MSTQAALTTVQHFIDGELTAGSSARDSVIWEPATGEEQARVLLAEADDVDLAVQAAKRALPGWSGASLARRTRVMFAFRELVRRADEIARLVSREHGKVVADARGEVTRGLEVVEFVCGLPQLLKGEFSDQVSTDVDLFSFRQPLGVCAGITPFNFPAMVPMWMHPVAIASGNTFVLKPSERDPSASNLIAELYRRPVCRTASSTSCTATRSPSTRCSITRTSPPSRSSARRRSRATCTSAQPPSGKRVQALGGAKNHAVVMPDADLDYAADQLIAAGFGSAGQRCMAISVAVAVGDAGDELVAKVAESARAQSRSGLGPGLRNGSRRHGAGARPDRRATSTRGAATARRSWSTGASSTRRQRRLLRRPDAASTTSRPTMSTSTPTRSSDRCSAWCASTRSTRRSS